MEIHHPPRTLSSQRRILLELLGDLSGLCVKNFVTGSKSGSNLYDRYVDDVFGDEPDLQLVATNYIADEKIIRPVVAVLSGQPRHGSRFLQDDLVRMKQPGDLDRHVFAPFRRPWN